MNENSEKLLALEALIYKFAVGQFAMNGVSSAEAALVMKSIYSNFSEACFRESLYQRINFNDQTEKQEEIEKTGEIADLMKDFYNTGLKPDKEDQDGRTEDCTAQEG